MRNRLNRNNLNERPAARAIVALSLTASLAAFGCTTNKTPGNGDPYRSGPGVGPTAAPTSGVTGTSSGGTVPNPPMMSSSTYVEALPSVNARAKRLPLSPDEAAAVMADHAVLSRSVKVLGPANPGPSLANSASPTINASTTFTTPVVGFAGGAAGPIVSGNDVVAVAGNNIGLVGTPAAVTTPTAGATVATPTNVGLPFSAGAFAAGAGATTTAATPTGALTGISTTNTGTFTPTVSSATVPSPTATSGAVVVNPGTAPTVSRTTTAPTVSRTPTAGTSSTATVSSTVAAPSAGSVSANVASPARTVISNANGKVTVSKSQK